ncbi:hypothetical protein ACHAQA_007777 [Verticillium albo-atrum]
MPEMKPGRTAIVTGAGRGIGKAIAFAFAHAGYHVACVARTKSEIDLVALAINSSGSFPKAKAFLCDLLDSDAIKPLISEVRAWIDQPIHVLVNNAGVARIDAGEYQPDMEAWHRVIGTNLTAPVALSQEVLPEMLSAGSGVIISIGSRNAVRRMPFMTAYSVAKTALLRYHENLDMELHAKGIYNYYVAPPNVDTDILSGADAIDAVSLRHHSGVRHMVDRIASIEKVPADFVATTCVRLCRDPNASVLSGRYVDTEGDIDLIFQDIEKGKEKNEVWGHTRPICQSVISYWKVEYSSTYR